jgi:dihydrofolate reductase
MPLSFVCSVVEADLGLAIGHKNHLLFRLKEDLRIFRQITTFHLGQYPFNVVVMGRETYSSIGKPLPNRLNCVLTHDTNLHSSRRQLYPFFASLINGIFPKENMVYLSLQTFIEFYTIFQPNVFVIGGAQIFYQFLNTRELLPDKLYITEIFNKLPVVADVFLNKTMYLGYDRIGVSEMYSDSEQSVEYQIVHWRKTPKTFYK